MAFIRTRDPEERQLLDEIRKEGAVLLNETLDNLARKIVKEQSDAQKRGSKKKS